MQRYRVNLPLLIALTVGSAVLIGGSFGLYRFQKSRNASRLLDREKIAREEGDVRESAKLLIQYLGLRVNDEDAMVLLSEALITIAEEPKSEPINISKAWQQSEVTLRNFPDQDELRRRLVDLYMSPRVRGLKQALDHIAQLLNRNPGDAELLAMQSECLFAAASTKAVAHAYKLIGYDEQTDEFDAEKATAPSEPIVYLRLAQKLRSEQYEEALADRVIDQMIEANPENGTAYLLRGQYREIYEPDGKELALEDIRRALELDPDDASIVAANSRMAARDEDFETASQLLVDAIEKHPTSPMLYQTLSQVRASNKDIEGSIDACNNGLDAVPEDQWAVLLVQKAQLELQANRLDDVRETVKRMRDTRSVIEVYPDYFEARLWMGENKWFEAAQVFDKYEPVLSSQNPPLGLELNCMLGLCRERLGQDELALGAFDRALSINAGYKPAELGRQRMLAKIGRASRGNEGVSIYAALALELAKPEEMQDWEAFDAMAQEYVERMQLGEAMLEVLRGEVFMRRKMYPEARKALIRSYKMAPENLGVRRAAVKLFAADPDQGPVKALKLLDKVVEDFGDLPILRLERANLLTAIYPDDLTEQLFAIGEGTESWEVPKQVQLWRGLAGVFGRLRDQESRSECLDRVAQLMPNDLQALVESFELARDKGDDAQMRAVQEKILAVVRNEEDPIVLYAEATRLLSEWTATGRTGDQLERAGELIERALAQRGEWHKLHNLKANLALGRGDVRAALASFDREASLSRQDPRAMFQYIKLLMSRSRYADALLQLEKLGRDGRIRLLGQDYAECLLRVGRAAEAVVIAEEYVELAPNNPTVQLWKGRFLSRSARASELASEEGRSDELIAQAGEALNKVVQLNPRSAEGWLALVGYYASNRDFVKADDTIREAQLMLEEDGSRLLFARCYEMVGRGMDAEALYKQALEGAADKDRPGVARLMAQFYLGGSYRRPDSIDKATPLINEILRAVDSGIVKPEDASARWARSSAARLFAKRGGYQDLLDAERLLSSNAQGGALPLEDRLLMAEILAPRPEAVSRLKAARLLEEISQNQRLSQKSELDLGKLYYAVGQWRKCREQMLGVIARYPDDIGSRLAYLEMLLRRGGSNDIDEAVRQVKRLEEVAPKQLATRDMLARVAFEKGRKQDAARIVVSLLPRDLSKITPEQLPLVRQVAARLAAFGDLERSRKLLEVAANVGELRDRFALAQFIGEHVDAQAGLDAIAALRQDATTPQVVARGLRVLYAVDKSGNETPDAMFDTIQGWLDRGLREDPDLIALRLQQGELYDLRRDYTAAVEAYRGLLDHPDLIGPSRAVVLNNLAYLLALAQKDNTSLAEAGKYTAEAVGILGPSSDILDTRAVIAIADQRYEDAISDLKLAVLDAPTASKYFHLAAAYAGSGKPELAAGAWAEAIDRGLTRESVSRLEREQYDRIKQQVESGAITSVMR